MIDYYVKHLPFDARQEIFKALEDVGVVAVEYMLEKEDGYPSFKMMRYTDEEIVRRLQKEVVRFQRVNELMIKYGRPPLFADPADTYACALQYVELMRRYETRKSEYIYTDFGIKRETIDVLINKMGCTWDEYVPVSYPETTE